MDRTESSRLLDCCSLRCTMAALFCFSALPDAVEKTNFLATDYDTSGTGAVLFVSVLARLPNRRFAYDSSAVPKRVFE